MSKLSLMTLVSFRNKSTSLPTLPSLLLSSVESFCMTTTSSAQMTLDAEQQTSGIKNKKTVFAAKTFSTYSTNFRQSSELLPLLVKILAVLQNNVLK